MATMWTGEFWAWFAGLMIMALALIVLAVGAVDTVATRRGRPHGHRATERVRTPAAGPPTRHRRPLVPR